MISMDRFGEVAEKLRRSTVFITAGRHGQGSGTIVQPDGLIVTNSHVVAFEPIRIQLWDGARAEANLIKRDSARDLAIVGIPKSSLPAATLADSDTARVGEVVMAVGNPMGFIGALTRGVIYGVGRVPGLGPSKWIQSDIRLAPGNSGGPLANVEGQVLGINTMITRGLGLAVPSSAILRFLGSGAKPSLGVTIRPVEVECASRVRLGLLVLQIDPHSAAARASLLPGDIFVSAEGRYFGAIDDFENVLQRSDTDSVIRLQFFRGDQTKIRTVAVRLLASDKVAA